MYLLRSQLQVGEIAFLCAPADRNFTLDRLKCSRLAVAATQEQFGRLRTQKSQGKDILHVAVCEPVLACEIGQPRRFARNDQLVPGASTSNGFGDGFLARW